MSKRSLSKIYTTDGSTQRLAGFNFPLSCYNVVAERLYQYVLAWCVDQQFLYSYKAKIDNWSWQEISRISAEDQYGKISSQTVKVRRPF